jgi:hypothetical protein
MYRAIARPGKLDLNLLSLGERSAGRAAKDEREKQVRELPPCLDGPPRFGIARFP